MTGPVWAYTLSSCTVGYSGALVASGFLVLTFTNVGTDLLAASAQYKLIVGLMSLGWFGMCASRQSLPEVA